MTRDETDLYLLAPLSVGVIRVDSRLQYGTHKARAVKILLTGPDNHKGGLGPNNTSTIVDRTQAWVRGTQPTPRTPGAGVKRPHRTAQRRTNLSE